MSRRPDTNGEPILGIEASARADELSVREAARPQVHFTGKGKVVTQRQGLPPEGTRAGETHRRISISTRILALHPVVELGWQHRHEPSDREQPVCALQRQSTAWRR